MLRLAWVVVLGFVTGCESPTSLTRPAQPPPVAADPWATPGPSPATPAAPSLAPPSAGAVPDDQFEFHSQNGMTYVPETMVIERGRSIGMDGIWKDSRHDVVLELRGTRYRLTYQASSNAGVVQFVETGTWVLDERAMVMTPSAATRSSVNVIHTPGATYHQEGDSIGADRPRRWEIDGVMLEYIRYEDNETRRVEGLTVDGPAPSWAGAPDGRWTWALRRAG